MYRANQSGRLTNQNKQSNGVIGIFGETAKNHDLSLASISRIIFSKLKENYPKLIFRYRSSIFKSEINKKLQNLDSELGQTLFLENSKIKPDGGIIEVKDNAGKWRVILVSEAKFQGKDVENIEKGILVGKNNDKDLMLAGNAIERTYKNISEIANFMLSESYFPYVIFLEGSNFLTKTISVKRPDGRSVILNSNSSVLNRLDRLTAANYGMPLNTNLCINKVVKNNDRLFMLQAASIYTKGDGSRWTNEEMFNILMDIAKTSIEMLNNDIKIP